MRLKIILKDKEDNEYSVETLQIDQTIWDNFDFDNKKTITWLQVFELLKGIEEKGIQIKQPFYFPGYKLIITQC